MFRRGFLRSYLGALGLEQEAWMRRFEETCRENGVSEPGGKEWVTFAENVKNSRAPTRRRMGMRWFGAGLVLLSLALAGWCGWRLAPAPEVASAPPVWNHLKSGLTMRPPGNLLFPRLKLFASAR